MTKFPNKYPFLQKNNFSYNEYSIIPIRYEDRMDIMKWRNEQIYHLRQKELLTAEKQDNYFKNIVSKLFEQNKPEQVLFSYLKNNKCIGYGGLVHINWIDRYAEISFIMDTSLEEKEFEIHWVNYLKLIEEVAFENLGLHKIFTYAFDLRPHLYKTVEKAGFTKEATLKEHFYFDGEFKGVVIHSKYQNPISIRKISLEDVDFTYLLANDKITRENSYNQDPIIYFNHEQWFTNKIKDNSSFYFIGEYNRQKAAFLRIDVSQEESVIGIAVDKKFRGKRLSSEFLKLICIKFSKLYINKNIVAYIKKDNIASIKAFEKAGFLLDKECEINGEKSFRYVYKK